MASRPRQNRPRRLLVAVLALAAVSACAPATDPEGTPKRVSEEVHAALEVFAANELARDPELATRLQLGSTHNQLTDRSQAAFERLRLDRLETREALARLPRPADASALQRDLDATLAALAAAEPLVLAGHGSIWLGQASPYAVDHLRGAYRDVPELLVRVQPVRTAEEADAFLARLAALPQAIDDERRRLEADAEAGVLPPRPILDRMQAAAAVAAATPAEQSAIAMTFEGLLLPLDGLEAGAKAERISAARRIISERLRPAYDRLSVTLAELAEDASEIPGIWRLESGTVYYAASLNTETGGGASAAALHAAALDDVNQIRAELVERLATEGYAEGPLGARLNALTLARGQLYPDSEQGRAAIIERVNTLMRLAEMRLGRIVPVRPMQRPAIRSVPSAFEPFAPASAYRWAAGSSGLYEINLRNLSDWPDHILPTRVANGTIPGRHLANAVARAQGEPKPIRLLIGSPAFEEGWAAYAETLAEEAGLYRADPLGRIGYLRERLVSAARVVADTGIHDKRWSRPQAIEFLTLQAGMSPEAAADDVDRMSVLPGRASSAWAGRRRIMDLRDQAAQVLGPQFDIKAFHMVVLAGGPRPLDVVETDVVRWYKSVLHETPTR